MIEHVVGINPEDNIVVVGTQEDLKKQEMYIRDLNYLKYDAIQDGMQCLVKVRYKHKGEMRNTSGWNAVVVAGKIIEKIGPILAINNLQASNKF